jgi:hypothetical protein
MFITASDIRDRSSSKLAGRIEKGTLSLTYPQIEKSRSVNSGDSGGQTTVPPRPIHDDLLDNISLSSS